MTRSELYSNKNRIRKHYYSLNSLWKLLFFSFKCSKSFFLIHKSHFLSYLKVYLSVKHLVRGH